MIDWLLVWGVSKAAGVIIYPILEDLAKDAAKDYGKDFFKDCLKKVIRLPEPDVLKEAYGKALKEFLELIEEELKDAGYQEAIIKQYIPFLQKFVKREEVSTALGMAFNVECKAIDTALLVRVWTELNSPHLPESMNWDFLSKSYIRAVKKIVQNSDKLRPIFEVQTLDKIADAVQEVAGIAPAFDLEKYAEGLREQYGNLKLESLDTTGVYYNELKLWKIFIPQNLRECQEFIPQVYELPKDRARLLQESGQLDVLEFEESVLEGHRKRYMEQVIRGVFEVLGDPKELVKDGVAKYAVILGDPGSGKSTLLQYLALIWAERPVRDLPLYPLPLLLELRTYARDKQAGKCKDIVSFIHGGNITCRLNQQDLHEKLNRGDVIALFDGIDEVFDPALRDEVVTDIHRFTNDYPTVRAVATSRIFGYSQHKLRGAGFQHFMLQDLDDEQMQKFVQLWHDLNFVEGADKDRKRERLQKAIRESRSIKELAGNPLLLTMMAILNQNQELPRDRPELYNQASRVLLHQWDLENKFLEDPKLKDWKITVDLKDKQAMLRKVAYYMQSSKKGLSGNLISAIDLENILTEHLRAVLEKGEPRMVARLIIKQLHTRNFILCDLGGDSYGFVHRTFLEYFCAWEFVWQFKESQTLTIEKLIHDVFGNHWQDESWHEVLRLISGMIEPTFVADIIDFLLEQKVNKIAFLDEDDRLEKEGLSNLLLATDCFVEVRNKNLINVTSSKLLKILQSEVEQENSYKFNFETAITIISTIATNWKDSPEILTWLKQCIKSDFSSYIPELAVEVIVQNWKEDLGILSWLESIIYDRNWAVRKSALEAISQGWENDSKFLSVVRNLAVNDWSYDVRISSLQAIALSCKNEPKPPLIIKKLALKDESWTVRIAAIETIIQGWKFDPKNIYLWKHIIFNDRDYGVRQAAVEVISQSWEDNDKTIFLLKKIAANNVDHDMQSAAVELIVKGIKNNQEIFALFRKCALNSEKHSMRNESILAIIKEFQDYSHTFVLLHDVSLNDPFIRENIFQTNPRQTALEAILEHYSDKTQTLELLKTVSNKDPDEKLKEFAKEELAKLSENPVGA
jgi:predicted NACHT family NTPase